MLQNNMLPEEDMTALCVNHWKVLQKKQGFRFSIDAVLLAHFIAPAAGQRLLDLGTGSAVLPLLLAARHEGLSVDGIELQPAIADMARRSVAMNGAAQQIQILQGDITCLSREFHQRYDWVISNPPFFPVGTGRQNPDPQIALARHELACTLAQLIQAAGCCLRDRGRFAMIHRAERLTEILSLCQQHRLTPARLRLVHPYASQPANLVLVEAVRCGKNGLTVLPPLVIYEPDGSYTQEVLSYYR